MCLRLQGHLHGVVFLARIRIDVIGGSLVLYALPLHNCRMAGLGMCIGCVKQADHADLLGIFIVHWVLPELVGVCFRHEIGILE